ncbi:MAG: 2-dehydropantoate 2-reductase [Aquificae bacterium]|nr:2-dehydropantoate 2-reductase [Aquificota bacterium]
MRVLVFGLGALGSVFAAFLKKAGHDVFAVGRPRVVEAVKKGGLKVSGLWGEHGVKLEKVYPSVEGLPEREFDLVILTVKSYDTERALEELKKVSFRYLMLAQNGYGNYERAVEVFGPEKVILSRVIFGARLVSPGEAEVTVSADDVVIGSPAGAIDGKFLEELARLLSEAGIPTRHEPAVYKYLWDKILYNSALNALGALLETNYGTLARLEETRELMDRVIEEIFAVAEAKGIELFHRSADEYKRLFYEKLLPPTAEHYPSTYWDLMAGKRTEVDALNGAIVRLGREAGVPTPVNEVITNLLKAKEKLKLPQG